MIYALTCERLRVVREQMVFLDDCEPNVEGARQAGIHAVPYEDNAQAIRDIETMFALLPTGAAWAVRQRSSRHEEITTKKWSRPA